MFLFFSEPVPLPSASFFFLRVQSKIQVCIIHGRALYTDKYGKENDWDQIVLADLVEGPVESVSHEEVVKAMGK